MCIFDIFSILNGHTHRDRKQCIVSVDAVMVGLHDIDDGCYWRHCQTQPQPSLMTNAQPGNVSTALWECFAVLGYILFIMN